MLDPITEATAYFEKLEADRQTAIMISEQKAEEAKLIKAQQEGFQAAMKILAGAIPASSCEARSDRPGGRRRRRDIRELIIRELSFSGQPMTTAQLAKAIDYKPERTETALNRLETKGKLTQKQDGRWILALEVTAKPNGPLAHAD
jgi:hypothetical protein